MKLAYIIAISILILPFSGGGQQITVSGRVIYKDGSPVNQAHVEVHFFGPTSGITPEATTNAGGEFTLQAPLNGRGVVSASKPSEGYPNGALALYEEGKHESLWPINLISSDRVQGIVLRFGEPDTLLKLRVVAMNTGLSLQSARVTISLVDKPDLFASYSVSEHGEKTIVLPRRPVNVRVSAPGYVDWSWTNPKSNGILPEKEGRLQKTILLTPKP